MTVRPCCLKSTARCRRNDDPPPASIRRGDVETEHVRRDTTRERTRADELTARLQLGHRLLDPRRDVHRHDVTRAPQVSSRYRDVVTSRQTTVRLPEELAAAAEAVARVKGVSVNALIVDSLSAEIERTRTDSDFTSRARKLLERDRELIERLAK